MKLLYLKEILERETDENHGITLERILQLLEMKGVSAERKSIYDDISRLTDIYGLDIQRPSGQNKEYRLLDRTFEVNELKLLIDSIQASKFLSEKRTLDLIAKVKTLCSKAEAEKLQRQVIVANRVKTMNQSIHINVDTIHRAIVDNKQIQFNYFKYDLNKRRQYQRNGGIYYVSPWAMIYTDDNYYILGYEDQKFKHFRVDRMSKVAIAPALDRDGREEYLQMDMTAYTKYTFSMFGGAVEKVTMVFSNHLLGVVLDRFGHGVVATKADEKHFRITVTVAVSQQFFGWVFGLGKGVSIIAPDTVRNKMAEALKSLLEEKYQNN